MARPRRTTGKRGHPPHARRPPLSRARLDSLVDEAIVDAYGDSEQAVAFFTLIDDHLAVPFETTVLGVTVVVERVEFTDREDVVAVCRRDRHRQAIPVLHLPVPSPPPAGAEWIEAYRHWARLG